MPHFLQLKDNIYCEKIFSNLDFCLFDFGFVEVFFPNGKSSWDMKEANSESWNHRMIQVGETLKMDHLVLVPCQEH